MEANLENKSQKSCFINTFHGSRQKGWRGNFTYKITENEFLIA